MSHISRAHLGISIRKVRRRMGVSQIEVAQLANVSRRTIQNAEAGKASVKSSSLRAIADVLNLNVYQSDSFEDDGPAISNIASFSYLPFQMFKFVGARFQPGELSFCRNEKEFRSIIETLWQNFQIGIAKLCPIQAEAMRSAQPEFCQSKGYFQRYLDIWRANPKSFSFSSSGDRRTGVSIILPVSKSTFTKFTEGRLSNFNITGDQIVPQSPYVIYESIAPFFDLRDCSHSPSNSLAVVSLNHLAHLLPHVQTNTCEVASFGAHQENIDKLRQAGLKPTGRNLHKLGLPIWHVTNCKDFHRDEDQLVKSSTLLHFLSLKQDIQSLRVKCSFAFIGALQTRLLVQQSKSLGLKAA